MKPGAEPLGEQSANKKKAPDIVRLGLNWEERRDKKIRGGTIHKIDTNWWKSFAVNRWKSSSPRVQNDSSQRPNEPGGLYLWGTDPHSHSTFGSHQVSETAKRLEDSKTGRKVDFWSLKPNKPDNEYFDGVVGCCVLANVAGGVELRDSGLNLAQSKGRKKLSAAELRAIREAKRNG